jgi:hypothetical protein
MKLAPWRTCLKSEVRAGKPGFMGFRLDLGGFWLILTTCNGFLKNLLQQSGCSSIVPAPFPLEGFGDDR